jgi:hypothetical protein
LSLESHWRTTVNANCAKRKRLEQIAHNVVPAAAIMVQNQHHSRERKLAVHDHAKMRPIHQKT